MLGRTLPSHAAERFHKASGNQIAVVEVNHLDKANDGP
jgi:hypothetical protein